MISLLELVLLIIISHAWLVDIYEFFLFQGPYQTHRFKEKIYPQKYSFFKRYLMLTYYDNDLINECRYPKQMKAVLISDRINFIFSLFIIILSLLSIAFDVDIPFLSIIKKCYFVVFILFNIWFTVKSIRWEEWIKGKWKAGQFEFKIKLPDDK